MSSAQMAVIKRTPQEVIPRTERLQMSIAGRFLGRELVASAPQRVRRRRWDPAVGLEGGEESHTLASRRGAV